MTALATAASRRERSHGWTKFLRLSALASALRHALLQECLAEKVPHRVARRLRKRRPRRGARDERQRSPAGRGRRGEGGAGRWAGE